MIGRQSASATFVLLLSGCATIAPKTPEVADVPVRKTQQEVVRKEGALGRVEQSGTSIKVMASRVCDVVERPTVSRTTRTNYENKSSGTDWLLAISGVGFAGLGVGAIVDVPNVASADDNGPTYNPLGKGGATGLGVASIAAGAGLLAVSIVDVVRAQKSDSHTEEVTLEGTPVRAAVQCANEPLPRATATMKVGAETLTLGETGPDGRLAADLDGVLARDWSVPSSPKETALVIADSQIGPINLEPLFKVREERAFASTSSMTCASPKSVKDCDSLKEFVGRYPDGPHSAEARRLISEAGPKLDRLADEEAWRPIDPEACATKKLAEPYEIDQACAPLQSYLTRFSDGQHAREAESALKKGAARSKALAETIERRQRAEAAERARREKAAEQAREAQRAQEAKEQALERCNTCKANCSGKAPECLMKCVNVCGGVKK